MRAHIIENGVVVNTIEATSLDIFPDILLIDASLGGQIGDSWDGQVFTPPPAPPEPIPFSVSSRQGQLALLAAGYLDDVEMMIASIPDDMERRRAQIEFGATMWERSNPFLQQMWAQLGGDSDGLNNLFRAAIKL